MADFRRMSMSLNPRNRHPWLTGTLLAPPSDLPQIARMLEGRRLVARAGQLVADRLQARAEAGDAEAMYELGKWYQYAPNEADWRSAHYYRWYKRAMNQGLACAALAAEEVLSARHALFGPKPLPDRIDDALRDRLRHAFLETAGALGIPCPADVDPTHPDSDALYDEFIADRAAHMRRAEASPEEEARLVLEYNVRRRLEPGTRARQLAQAHERRTEAEAEHEAWWAAEDRGGVDAMETLAQELLTGERVPRRPHEGRRWLERASAHGSASAWFALGYLAERGIGGPRSRADADRAYENAHVAGSPWGGVGLGMLAQVGAAAPHLAQEAVARYEAFLAASPPEAGWPLYAQDVTTRLAWLHVESPAKRDVARALALLDQHSGFIRGHLIEDSGGDPIDAVAAYIEAAYLYDYGYPDEREREADHRLARLYLSGALGPYDPMAAIALLEGADNPPALFLAAALLTRGDTVPPAPARAARLTRRAARAWVADATRHLHFIDAHPAADLARRRALRSLPLLEAAFHAGQPEAGLDLAWLALRLGAPGWPISRVLRGLRQVGLAGCGPAWALLALLQDRDRIRAPEGPLPPRSPYRLAARAAEAEARRAPRPRTFDWHRLGLPSHVSWSPRYLEARLALLDAEAAGGMSGDEYAAWRLDDGTA